MYYLSVLYNSRQGLGFMVGVGLVGVWDPGSVSDRCLPISVCVLPRVRHVVPACLPGTCVVTCPRLLLATRVGRNLLAPADCNWATLRY